MAIYKAHSLHSTASMAGCISYITDIRKTSRLAGYPEDHPLRRTANWEAAGLFISLLHLDDIDTAAQQMAQTREASGRRRTHYGYHLIQSFATDAFVTAGMVHEIGCRMAELVFPGHEAVVATHLNKPHLHCHIAANSVALGTGRTVQYPKGVTYSVTALARYHGAVLLPKYGLEENFPGERKELKIYWRKRHWKADLREDVNLDIRTAAAYASSVPQMLHRLEEMGYEVRERNGKRMIRPPDREHFWNIAKFYRDWELLAMTQDSAMRFAHAREQSRMHALLRPVSPADTIGGRLTKMEAEILYWIQVLRRHDRMKTPDMPHATRKEMRRALKAFRALHRSGAATQEDVDAAIEKLIAKRCDINREIRELAGACGSAQDAEDEDPAEEAREQRRIVQREIRALRDVKGYAQAGREITENVVHCSREQERDCLPDH